MLILDEILGILDEGVISGDELCAIIAQARNADTADPHRDHISGLPERPCG